MAVAKEGLPFIAVSLAVNLLFLKIFPWAGIGSLFITVFIVFFFRDPERVIRPREDAILSPADGCITEAGPEKISIYLSLLDVHVNRSPIGGIVESVKYSPGRFHPAFDKKALTENENNLIHISNDRVKVAVRQIAGKLARRIVCYCRKKDTLKQGDRIGIIRFGSCVQVDLPEGVVIKIRCGEKVRAGETILAILK